MIKRLFLSLSITFWIVLSSIAQAVGPEMATISPATGVYLDKSPIAFTVLVQAPGDQIEHVEYFVNGQRSTHWFERCMTKGYTAEQMPYLSCTDVSAAMFGFGHVMVEAEIHMRRGRVERAQAEYLILQTQIEEVTRLTLPAKEVAMDTRIALDTRYQYHISASGKVALWPENHMSLTALPEGSGRPCNHSRCHVPGAPAGMLVAHFGDGRWFPIGAEHTVEHRSGILFLSVNDHEFRDNLGSFEIEVKKFSQ